MVKPDVYVMDLTAKWRLAHDGLQWILQKRKGQPRPNNNGWASERYYTRAGALADAVERHCEGVHPAVVAKIRGWPDYRQWAKEGR